MAVPIAVRSSRGLKITKGLPNCDDVEGFTPVGCKECVFSSDGKYFAYVNNPVLKILRTDTWKEVAVIEGAKAYHLAFSPKGTYLMTWRPFIVNSENPQGAPNLNVYKTEDGSLVKNFVHKKQTNWEPQWSADERIFSRMVNTDVIFYEECNFERILYRINCYKVASYSLSPTPASGIQYVLCHTPGGSGQPSFGRLFKYPNFEATQIIASRSFFQCDKVEFYWNSKGTHALLLSSTEVDKTGGSYYGKQGLNFIGISGETSMVTLGKEGPIYSVSWSPKGTEFCVVYGFTPAKATLFNIKCEPVFELGSGPRNSIYYNPQGNILLLGGFGNLRGQVELWDANNRKLIGKCDAPDSTKLEWCPDGVHFLTATTAPRLRIGNGFKIWHHTGVLLYERLWPEDEELYDVTWQKSAKDVYPEPTISQQKVKGIETSQPQASKQAYRPPSARNKQITFKLHDDDDDNVDAKSNDKSNPSKAALKRRKKREAKKARKAEEGDESPTNTPPTVSSVQINLTGDPEKDKKIKNIKKKLDAIEKLKEQQAQGKNLEINQLAKINGENDLIRELEQLQV